MNIAVIGPDGSGKTTYVNYIYTLLKDKGYQIHYPFNYFIIRKLINLATHPKTKKNSQTNNINNNIFFKFWPIISLIDNYIDFIFNIKIKYKNKVICERYYYDLATSFAQFGYTFNWLYKLYLILIPKPDICFILLASKNELQKRETCEFHNKSFFKNQISRYTNIQNKFDFIKINTEKNSKMQCIKIINKYLKYEQKNCKKY